MHAQSQTCSLRAWSGERPGEAGTRAGHLVMKRLVAILLLWAPLAAFADTFNATLAGRLDAKLLRQIRTELKTMRTIMREQLAREEIETGSYLRASGLMVY